jgi:hypothetical protein
MQIMGKAEIEMLHSLIQHYKEIIPILMADFTMLFTKATEELHPVEKRLVVIKLLHYKNDLISERKNLAQKKLANQQERNMDPNEYNPQMGQQTGNQQQNQRNTQPRQQNYQQNNLYRPRSQQRQQQRNWEDENSTENWQEAPREQRIQKRRGRGRGRM